MTLTPKQHRTLRAAARYLDQDDDDRRAFLAEHGGVRSSTQLTPAGYARVLAAYHRAGFPRIRPEATRAPGGYQLTERGVLRHATPKQERMVCAILRKLGWTTMSGDIDWARIDGLIRKRFPGQTLATLGSKQCSLLIEQIKAMQARGYHGDRRGWRPQEPRP